MSLVDEKQFKVLLDEHEDFHDDVRKFVDTNETYKNTTKLNGAFRNLFKAGTDAEQKACKKILDDYGLTAITRPHGKTVNVSITYHGDLADFKKITPNHDELKQEQGQTPPRRINFDDDDDDMHSVASPPHDLLPNLEDEAKPAQARKPAHVDPYPDDDHADFHRKLSEGEENEIIEQQKKQKEDESASLKARLEAAQHELERHKAELERKDAELDERYLSSERHRVVEKKMAEYIKKESEKTPAFTAKPVSNPENTGKPQQATVLAPAKGSSSIVQSAFDGLKSMVGMKQKQAGKLEEVEAQPAVAQPITTKTEDLDIKERQLKDEQAKKEQLKIGRNPHIRITPYDVNMRQILHQIRPKYLYSDLINVKTTIPRPNHKNLSLVDPFL